jgi:peptidoglycan hydrolase-like protein with peptidoglycan-binding domain
MRFGRFALISVCVVVATVPALAFTHAHRGPTSPKLFTKRSTKAKTMGQRGIEDDRATQIQTALIHSGYLTGTPSGHWDEQTEAAMTKLQADNGWQTKLVPDSRGLIKLGLGPSSAYSSAPGQSSATNQAGPLTSQSSGLIEQ